MLDHGHVKRSSNAVQMARSASVVTLLMLRETARPWLPRSNVMLHAPGMPRLFAAAGIELLIILGMVRP